MKKWKDWKEAMKTPAGRRAAVTVLVCCFLSGALYTANYTIPGNEEAIAEAAAEYVGKDIKVLDRVQKGNGMVVTFVEDEEVPDLGGTVTFKRGVNFLWLPMSANYGTFHDVIESKTFSDYGLLGAKEHTVVYALDAPQNISSWSMDYYDSVAYEEDGDITLLTMEGDVPAKHFAQYVEEPIDWGYIHETHCYDASGQEVDNTYSDRQIENQGGTGKGTAEVGFWDGLCLVIFLGGLLLGKSILKAEGGDRS